MKAKIEITVTHQYQVDVSCQDEAEAYREQLHQHIANGGAHDPRIIGVKPCDVIKTTSGIPFIDLNW